MPNEGTLSGHPVGCTCLPCLYRERHAAARLRRADNAADARAREYGEQLRAHLDAFDRSEQSEDDVRCFTADLRLLAGRMEDRTTTAATGSTTKVPQ